MFPEIVSFGPITIHSYGFVIAVGILSSLYLMTIVSERTGFPPPDKVFDLVFVVVFAGFVGARLFYVIQEWHWYRGHPLEMFQIWKGGLTYYGGMMTSFAAFSVYVKLVRLPFLASADFVIPYIALTHAFGRLGCFLNGCCYGNVCHLPWAVKFPALPYPVHPTQIYEAVFNLILFGFLVWFYARRRFSGQITSVYLIAYPVGRFFLEFLRGDQQPHLFSLTLQQILSLTFMAVGLILYGILRHRSAQDR